MKTTFLLEAVLATATLARDVPSNVQSFHDRIQQGKCTGGTLLQDGFYSKAPTDGGSKSFAYCQDSSTGVIYIKGNKQLFTNMDIDCDGDQSDPGDGRCGKSNDTQDETAFQDKVEEYSRAAGSYVPDLNANFVPYVVFGNVGSTPGYTNFNPQAHNMQPLSIMAVVCGNKLIYGVWGDINGDDGPPMVGEASISLATACYGTSITGDNGHDQDDVIFIGFPGTVAETVNKNADWSAKRFDDFENSIQSLGDQLVANLA